MFKCSVTVLPGNVRCQAKYTSADKLKKHVLKEHGVAERQKLVITDPTPFSCIYCYQRHARTESRNKHEHKCEQGFDKFTISRTSTAIKHPSCMVVLGPSQSGKTTTVRNLLLRGLYDNEFNRQVLIGAQRRQAQKCVTHHYCTHVHARNVTVYKTATERRLFAATSQSCRER